MNLIHVGIPDDFYTNDHRENISTGKLKKQFHLSFMH